MVLDHSRYEGVYQNYYETSILTSNAAKKNQWSLGHFLRICNSCCYFGARDNVSVVCPIVSSHSSETWQELPPNPMFLCLHLKQQGGVLMWQGGWEVIQAQIRISLLWIHSKYFCRILVIGSRLLAKTPSTLWSTLLGYSSNSLEKYGPIRCLFCTDSK